MNPAKLLLLFTFGFLFVAFALASNNSSCVDTDVECGSGTMAAEILKAKREMSDAPTILMYFAIAAIIIIPQIPQLDI
jgi:hypothetical protein